MKKPARHKYNYIGEDYYPPDMEPSKAQRVNNALDRASDGRGELENIREELRVTRAVLANLIVMLVDNTQLDELFGKSDE